MFCSIEGEYYGQNIVKVSFTVDLACSSKRCLSHSAESPLSLLYLVYGFPLFYNFPPAKLALLGHPNYGTPSRGYSKFLNYKEVRLKIDSQ